MEGDPSGGRGGVSDGAFDPPTGSGQASLKAGSGPLDRLRTGFDKGDVAEGG